MPIYQYVCSKCNTSFELKQGFNDESIAACPNCKCEARRRFVPVPIIFKGSGFYVTDSKSPSAALNPAKTPDLPKAEDSKPKDSGPKDSGPKDSKAKEPESPKKTIV